MAYGEIPDTNPYQAPMGEIGPEKAHGFAGYTGYAGFWLRFVAAIIDGIVVNVVSFAIGFTIGIILVAAQVDPAATGPQIALNLLGLLIGIGYYAGMTASSTQATLGKMAMGIKVTDLYGRPISFGRAVGRELAKILSVLILFIGYIMVAFTEKKQGLHDMIAGTLVLKTR